MAYQKLQQSRAAAVTPSDTDNIPYVGYPTETWPCVLYSGSGGIIRVLTSGGDDVTFESVPAGVVLPIQVIRVFSSTTSATDIVALW